MDNLYDNDNSDYNGNLNIATQFMYKIYAWMGFGLSLTAVTAYFVSHTSLAKIIMQNMGLLLVLFLIQLGLVIGLSFFIQKLSYATASFAFILYSIITGLTLSSLFLVYTNASLVTTFAICASMFIFLALYGYYTKKDLTSWGSILLMALFGLIIGMIVNLFLKSSSMQFILSAIGVILFSLLTAYDVQKLKNMSNQFLQEGHMFKKVSILGALTLYLDFINLFLMLLNFTGSRKD